MASTGTMPLSGKWVDGAELVRNLLPKRAVARSSAALEVMVRVKHSPAPRDITHFGWVLGSVIAGVRTAAADRRPRSTPRRRRSPS